MKSLNLNSPFLATFILLITTVCYNINYAKNSNLNIAFTETNPVNLKSYTDPDKLQLIGEWSKSGTPTVIKITGVQDSGKLEINYFDPKLINISKASWLKTGNLLSVFIELEDINYPNSNFKLNYIPERDVLVGEFYDAASNINYSIEFVRIQ